VQVATYLSISLVFQHVVMPAFFKFSSFNCILPLIVSKRCTERMHPVFLINKAVLCKSCCMYYMMQGSGHSSSISACQCFCTIRNSAL